MFKTQKFREDVEAQIKAEKVKKKQYIIAIIIYAYKSIFISGKKTKFKHEDKSNKKTN